MTLKFFLMKSFEYFRALSLTETDLLKLVWCLTYFEDKHGNSNIFKQGNLKFLPEIIKALEHHKWQICIITFPFLWPACITEAYWLELFRNDYPEFKLPHSNWNSNTNRGLVCWLKELDSLADCWVKKVSFWINSKLRSFTWPAESKVKTVEEKVTGVSWGCCTCNVVYLIVSDTSFASGMFL